MRQGPFRADPEEAVKDRPSGSFQDTDHHRFLRLRGFGDGAYRQRSARGEHLPEWEDDGLPREDKFAGGTDGRKASGSACIRAGLRFRIPKMTRFVIICPLSPASIRVRIISHIYAHHLIEIAARQRLVR